MNPFLSNIFYIIILEMSINSKYSILNIDFVNSKDVVCNSGVHLDDEIALTICVCSSFGMCHTYIIILFHQAITLVLLEFDYLRIKVIIDFIISQNILIIQCMILSELYLLIYLWLNLMMY